jgi:hypothetical protein
VNPTQKYRSNAERRRPENDRNNDHPRDDIECRFVDSGTTEDLAVEEEDAKLDKSEGEDRGNVSEVLNLRRFINAHCNSGTLHSGCGGAYLLESDLSRRRGEKIAFRAWNTWLREEVP